MTDEFVEPRRTDLQEMPVSAESGSTPTFTVYSTPWCGYCTRLKKQLTREGVTFAEVDIEQDPSAEQLVKKVNGGNATVPTLIFTDGSAMTNPSLRDVLAKIAA
jgi:mycoredoxin